MSISVEHDKRKEEILDKALDVFVDEGYKDTTFQKIAERCGITRTILYLYFNNKKEIFSSCIKRFMEGLEHEIRRMAGDASLGAAEKLVSISQRVVKECATESKLLSVVLDYLLRMKTAGGDPDERVRRRTIRMRHILAAIIIEGKRKGEFPETVSVKATSELIYALIEAAVFRITVLGQKDASPLEASIALLAGSLGIGPSKPGED
ncbi:MAG: TetR family transcriptional regulator [Spirochaetes bacterium]|nr:MAG: TetR family transcriptional regulator [Spirochaetota bacterium]